MRAPAPTRVLAFGVGDGATGRRTALNLRAISGPTAYNGSNVDDADYFQTPDYPAAGQALRDLALGNCEGTLTVTKQIVPEHGAGRQHRRRGPRRSGMAVHQRQQHRRRDARDPVSRRRQRTAPAR